MSHRTIRDLPSLLAAKDLLVVNRSRVFPARLLGKRPSGGRLEILLVKRREKDLWEALARPGRRIRAGDLLRIARAFDARVEDDLGDGKKLVRILGDDPDEKIERYGRTPLPPYVRRPDTPQDRERYQTVYARESGSVAAPTAGLHFTPDLLAELAGCGVTRAEIVLHVGLGTFQPVAVDEVEDHRVEPERFTIPLETAASIRETRRSEGRVVAVGTTTVRTLESAARDDGTVEPGEGETSLVITPGFRFRVVDVLLTNLHLPRSSLLLLACAFAGRETVLSAYAEAVKERYRFYSYGDAMLIL